MRPGPPGAPGVLAPRERAGCSTHLPRAPRGPSGGGRAARTGGGDWAGGVRRVTSRARVPAAEIGQPRRRWHSGGQRRALRAGAVTVSGKPGTHRQPERERPGEGRGVGWPPPPGALRCLPESGHLVFTLAPPLQVRGAAPERARGGGRGGGGVPTTAAERLPAGPGVGAASPGCPRPGTQVCPPGQRLQGAGPRDRVSAGRAVGAGALAAVALAPAPGLQRGPGARDVEPLGRADSPRPPSPGPLRASLLGA